jgi:hypothetical protein
MISFIEKDDKSDAKALSIIFNKIDENEKDLSANFSRALSDGIQIPTRPNGKDLVQYLFFLKNDSSIVSVRDAVKHVQFGTVSTPCMLSMLCTVSEVYVPDILSKKNWPEGIKKDFTGQMHKFMASLTEIANHSLGKTVLYLPGEDIADVESAGQLFSPC